MSPVITNLLLKSLAETLYMLSISAFIAAAAGIPPRNTSRCYREKWNTFLPDY